MSANLFIPKNYRPLLNVRETEQAIRLIKEFFQTNLAFELNLVRVTAPLFVKADTGINDDLNGNEKPISFPIKGMPGTKAEIVQSLAKWKRMALAELGFRPGEGLYTDMNAVRPDEVLDNTHSLYVDQWDWERVITPEERNLAFLKQIVTKIYAVICRTEKYLAYEYDRIEPALPETITFVHSEELAENYPELTPREREKKICAELKAVFIIGIGGPNPDGQIHDGRAPDYDDWTTPTGHGRHGLNGDIVVHNPILNNAFELSSMGIRVNPEILMQQLVARQATDRKKLLFHKKLLAGELPPCIGGGIGQSRLCMFYLRKAHIGEIQTGMWPETTIAECRKNNISLL